MSAFDAEVVIRNTRYVNEESGFAVMDADADGRRVVLVGPLIHLEERERARIHGQWVQDRRYGEQVKVAEAHPLPPSDAPALIAYLRRVRHVGHKRAEALVARHGPDQVLDAIDREPAAAFRGAGLGSARAQEAARSWHELRVTRQLHLLLAPHGLAYLINRIHAEYGPTAHRVVSANPYELTRVFGVGFATADRIARAGANAGAGAEQGAEHPGRSRAALIHLLTEAERNGSTCLPRGELLAGARELLGGDGADDELVDELVGAGEIVCEGTFVYRTATAELEAELAERIRRLADGAAGGRLREVDPDAIAGGAGLRAGTSAGTAGADDSPGPAAAGTSPRAAVADADAAPAGAARAPAGLALTAEQRDAVRAAFAQRLSVITGGPGTGKTATIRTIAGLATGQNARVLLVAPTGRAATRMTEASGFKATTVHSALGWIPGEGPTHDEQDPLKCDLLIVDECSMANLELMNTLLCAVGPTTHVVLVGDADQLAPVGAGKPFAELITSGVVPTARLSHIFRQAAGSMIVQGAHAIRRGEVPDFTAGPDMRRDLFLIERASALAAREEIVSLVCERLPAHYGVDPVSGVQVFAPVYRGELGIDALNEALRDALNPGGLPVRGGRLRLGDKLMMTGRNLHELGLMNGTLLRLIDEVAGDGDDPALVLESDESVFRLAPEEADHLRLAYACSVHRGQGIELPIAVIVAHPAAGAYFLRREMLYTAVTRATTATVIVGTREVVGRAARTPDTGKRHSRLGDRLAGA